MSEKFLPQIETQIATWAAVSAPNEAARAWAAQHEALIKGFEALRGTMQFEDEPASFEAALQATMESN